MIKVNKNETFPLLVSLLDEGSDRLINGKVVTYDVRTIDDQELNPTISGVLTESTTTSGIYHTSLSLPTAGSFACYITCNGFISEAESILVSEENIFELTRSHYPFNSKVMDVTRTTAYDERTPSQISRHVPYGKTDYIVTVIKHDFDLTWNNPIASGISYAHYLTEDSMLPYMMAGEF